MGTAKPTICAKCKHVEQTDVPDTLAYCMVSSFSELNYVTGAEKHSFLPCLMVNRGDCPKYEPKEAA
jgi:hypothetical protein